MSSDASAATSGRRYAVLIGAFIVVGLTACSAPVESGASQGTAPAPPVAEDGAGVSGAWDSDLSPEETSLLLDGMSVDERNQLGELTALRLGFDGARWYQGFVGDGEVWRVAGIPEGDVGTFTLDAATLTTENGQGVYVTYSWRRSDDMLRLTVEDCTDQGSACADLGDVKFMTERTWIRSSDDGSY